MKGNDIKKAFEGLELSKEKKDGIANNILTGGGLSPHRRKKYLPRGKQAAILVISLLLVYTFVFSVLPLLKYNGEESVITGNSEPQSNDNAQLQNDPSEKNAEVSVESSTGTVSVENSEKGDVNSTAIEQSEPETSVIDPEVSVDESDDISGEIDNGEWLTFQDIVLSAEFYPLSYIITSAKQLEKLGKQTADFTNDGSFFDADYSKYNDEYFKSNFLVITYFNTNYAHYKYEVRPKSTQNDTEDIVITITKINTPEGEHPAVCGFHCSITEWNGKYTGQLVGYESKAGGNVESGSLDIYYGLSDFKGIEVYVWEDNGIVYCGIMSGTNRLKNESEIEELKNHPATLEQMQLILGTYDIPESEIMIVSNTSYMSVDEIRAELDIS